MQEQIKELLTKIDYLEKMLNVQQQYLILSWAISAVIVGVLAFTMLFLIKSIVNDRVEKELIVIKNSLKNELTKDLFIDMKKNIQMESENVKSNLYSKLKTDLSLELIDYINRTKPIFWVCGKGTQVIGNLGNYTLNIYGLNMTLELDKTIISLEVISSLTGRKIACNYNPSISNETSVMSNLLDYNKEKDGQLVDWKIVWINGTL